VLQQVLDHALADGSGGARDNGDTFCHFSLPFD
jgi:hypothetical protein